MHKLLILVLVVIGVHSQRRLDEDIAGIFNGQLVGINNIQHPDYNDLRQGLGITGRNAVVGGLAGGTRIEPGRRLRPCQRRACTKQQIPPNCIYTPVLRDSSGNYCSGCPEDICIGAGPLERRSVGGGGINLIDLGGRGLGQGGLGRRGNGRGDRGEIGSGRDGRDGTGSGRGGLGGRGSERGGRDGRGNIPGSREGRRNNRGDRDGRGNDRGGRDGRGNDRRGREGRGNTPRGRDGRRNDREADRRLRRIRRRICRATGMCFGDAASLVGPRGADVGSVGGNGGVDIVGRVLNGLGRLVGMGGIGGRDRISGFGGIRPMGGLPQIGGIRGIGLGPW